ncbi:hypothetical protein AB8A21_09675 [Streptomyces sp. BF23-18]|uniref:hypothetical protein n=1 Tax=Streptomyces sp. BF23-18 TaxID=3240282 RepID=UPI0034E4BB67
MDPERTDLLVGNVSARLVAAAYECGHCTSEIGTRTDDTGIVHLVVAHDDDCPVLNGTLSAVPDALRAMASTVPDTFRP